MREMRIKEVFYSIQGEGHWTGRPAIFVRFSGCNLRCPFCDTDFDGGEFYTEEDLVDTITSLPRDCSFVVFTGGEPTLQLTDTLIDTLHSLGYYLAMETNGTRPYPPGIDWVTVSPKTDFCDTATPYPDNPVASEVKVVYNGQNEPSRYDSLGVEKFVQPCDTGDPTINADVLAHTVEWVKEHPDWRLSLQTHKIINVR